MTDSLDGLLAVHFKRNSEADLTGFEASVWHDIRTKQALPYWSWLSIFLPPQYRVATFAAALLVGLSLGHMTFKSPDGKKTFPSSQALNLQVFSVEDAHVFPLGFTGRI